MTTDDRCLPSVAVQSLMLLTGSSMWAYIIGSACGIIATLDPALIQYRQTLDELNFFVKDQVSVLLIDPDCSWVLLSATEFLWELLNDPAASSRTRSKRLVAAPKPLSALLQQQCLHCGSAPPSLVPSQTVAGLPTNVAVDPDRAHGQAARLLPQPGATALWYPSDILLVPAIW